MARCRNQPNELCVCMTAAARNQRKVVREELFACPRAIHPQLGHLGRRVLATETPDSLGAEDTDADVAGTGCGRQTVRPRASALVARKHSSPPRLFALLSISKPTTGSRPTMDCTPIRLLLMGSAAHLFIDGVRICGPAVRARQLVAL